MKVKGRSGCRKDERGDIPGEGNSIGRHGEDGSMIGGAFASSLREWSIKFESESGKI